MEESEIEMENILLKKENRLNVFFCSENEKNFNELKQEINKDLNDKINIIGEFNNLTILDNIYYYLGIKEKNDIVKSIRNVIILNISLENSENFLKDLVKNFRNNIRNDQHPFFIFLRKNEANFNKINLIKEINIYQNKFKNNQKLDSKNIFVVKENNQIKNILVSLFNYFNEMDEYDQFIVPAYNKSESKTINILVAGVSGSGKSSFINRILGEKRALSTKLSKTSKFNEYYHHGDVPLKLIDSEGFQIGTNKELETVDNYLKKNNLEHKNIDKKIHFIFYLFKSVNKIQDLEYDIIKSLGSFKVNIYFIITFNEREEEEMNKKELKNSFIDCIKEKKNKKNELIDLIKLIEVKTNEEELIKKDEKDLEDIFKNKINNSIFCIDSLDNDCKFDFPKLFSSLKTVIKQNIESSQKILDSIEKYEKLNEEELNKNEINEEELNKNELNEEELNKNESNKNTINNDIDDSNKTLNEGEKSPFLKDKEAKEISNINKNKDGILTTKPILLSPDNVIKQIQELAKSNIFFTDIKIQRNKLREEALKKISTFEKFFFFSNPFNFKSTKFNKKLEKLIYEISQIYDDVNKYRKEKNENKQYDTSQLSHKKKYISKGIFDFISVTGLLLTPANLILGPVIAIMPNLIGSIFMGNNDKKQIIKIARDIIEEYDKQYGKITIVDKYKMIANNLIENLNKIENFCSLLETKYWYDITMNEEEN